MFLNDFESIPTYDFRLLDNVLQKFLQNIQTQYTFHTSEYSLRAVS